VGLVTILTEREEDKESLAVQVWGVPYDKHVRAVPYAVARHFYYDCELACSSSSPLNRKHYPMMRKKAPPKTPTKKPAKKAPKQKDVESSSEKENEEENEEESMEEEEPAPAKGKEKKKKMTPKKSKGKAVKPKRKEVRKELQTCKLYMDALHKEDTYTWSNKGVEYTV